MLKAEGTSEPMAHILVTISVLLATGHCSWKHMVLLGPDAMKHCTGTCVPTKSARKTYPCPSYYGQLGCIRSCSWVLMTFRSCASQCICCMNPGAGAELHLRQVNPLARLLACTLHATVFLYLLQEYGSMQREAVQAGIHTFWLLRSA